jgi:hypothetical protein
MKRFIWLLVSLAAMAQTPPIPSGSWVVVACPTNCTGGGGSVHYGTGPLASRPACEANAVGVWFASDQPEGLQISTCSNVSGAYRWIVPNSPGASGALVNIDGTLDVANTIVPRLPAANTFGGQNSFGGVRLLPLRFADLPACGANTEGLHRWIIDGTSATWGAAAAGNGSSHVGVVCNAAQWTVYAK